MPQSEVCPRGYSQVEGESAHSAHSVHLRSSSRHPICEFSFEPVKQNLFRVTFSSQSHPIPPYPSVPQPAVDLADGDVVSENVGPNRRRIEFEGVAATVSWEETPVVSLSWAGSDSILHQDLNFRSYVLDSCGVAHYTVHDRNALHVGLGEKAAPMDLTGRGFIISATDSFGYNITRTDPLYKHIPLLIKATPDGCVAIFSTSHSRGRWAVGSEIDGLWGHFKVYRQDYGGLEEYLIVGRSIQEVVRTYAELAGFPMLVPRWAFGYISGGYKYTMMDDPPAHRALLDFADKLKEHDIPCSAHQMSSGYSIAEKEPRVRNVFTWNKQRFPDPEQWITRYHSLGIRLLANVKPYVLAAHPDYASLKDAGALFTDPDQGTHAVMRLWSAGGGESGDGSHLDFTSPWAFDWWYKGVQGLKRAGIDGIWNDNNEYTLPSDDWELSYECSAKARPGFDKGMKIGKSVGLWGRAMHTELMGKASHDALLDVAPKERPFVLTRSATAGTLRYACSSWSGDNMTSWESMKGANALSLTAGMCLMQCYGHDIGGFEGPQPSPELLLRWIQLGIHSPRFAINCFKTSPTNNSVGEVIEPWMYPEIIPQVRDTIKRRYELLPYIYSLSLESHLTACPPQRWTGWGYESDPEVWTAALKDGQEQYWFGDSLLVGGVYSPGVDTAKMYLPRQAQNSLSSSSFDYGFVSLNAPYNYWASGQWASIPSDWKTVGIPLLAKVGGAIPVGRRVQTRMPGESKPAACPTLEEDDWRGVEIFPPASSSHGTFFKSTWLEDDGISQKPEISRFAVRYRAEEERVVVVFNFGGGTKGGQGREGGKVEGKGEEEDDDDDARVSHRFVPAWRDLDFILHVGDSRHVVDADADTPLEYRGLDWKGRAVWRLKGVISDDAGREMRKATRADGGGGGGPGVNRGGGGVGDRGDSARDSGTGGVPNGVEVEGEAGNGNVNGSGSGNVNANANANANANGSGSRIGN